MAIRIRDATPGDVEIVCTFNSLLARESEDKDLDQDVLRRGVTAVLADPAKGRYFLAEEDGAILGQLAITYEYSDWREGWFWWIQSVYVTANARRRGIFRRMLQHIEETARAADNVVGLRLYVETNNHAARATYRFLGLGPTNYLVMEKYPL